MAVLWVAQLVRLWLTYAWKSLKILLLKRHKQNQKHGNALFHDSFSIIKKTVIASFLNSLNNIDPNISLTIELELDNKISLLDTLITRHGNNLKIDVLRKPTHTHRYLDFNSHHDIKHKISAARTLIHRALTLPSTHASKQDELNHTRTTLKCNRYPDKVVKQILRDSTPNTIVPSPEELVVWGKETLISGGNEGNV